MGLPTVDTPVEYGLYALATRCPELFESAERFCGGMLAEDQEALGRVKALSQLEGRAELLPAERIALTVAKAQVERGENPPINTTTVLVMALERLGEGTSE